MDKVTLIELLFAATGILFVGLGIPLMRGKVKPNPWYGFRTKKTLSDEKVWYAVNRASGLDMVIVGILVLACSVAMYFLGGSLGLDKVAVILLSVELISIVGMVVHGFSVLRRT